MWSQKPYLRQQFIVLFKQEELIRVYGPDEVSKLGIQSFDDGGNS